MAWIKVNKQSFELSTSMIDVQEITTNLFFDEDEFKSWKSSLTFSFSPLLKLFSFSFV